MNQEPTRPESYEFTIAGDAGVYTLQWPDLGIMALLSRFKRSSNKEVTAQLTITSHRPGSPGHITYGRTNLLSRVSKKQTALACAEKVPELAWIDIIEQISYASVNRWEAGEAAEKLEEVNLETETFKYLIDPIVLEGLPTLVYGVGSAGKSFLCQYLAVLADSGISHNELTVSPSRVLYLDWETTKSEVAARVTMIRRGLGLEGPPDIWYRPMYLGFEDDIERIRELVIQHEINFLVLDSLGSACAGEPESAEIVLGLFNALRSLKVTSLCIDHENREGTLFGSVYKFNASRQIWHARKAQQTDDTKIDLGLIHKKANNNRLMKPIGFLLNFSDYEVTIERQDLRNTDLETHLYLGDRIEGLLLKNPTGLTVTELSELLLNDKGEPVSANQISVLFSKDKTRREQAEKQGKKGVGRFMKKEDGRWVLLAHENEGGGSWEEI